ncbi:MAG: T9SS type A sorting domain-containing protein [Bacteroidota bacterium]
MKKILLFVTAITLTFSAVESKAQLATGSIAPDFTFPDLNSNTQHLYALLDSGYTVFIDVSAAWCGPCWNYHTGVTAGTVVGGVTVPALEGLYAAHGPNGDNKVRVMYIEGELTNTTAQLNGVAGSCSACTTQGNWVAGTLYPIVDLSTATPGASAFETAYAIHYFPTVYMVCPDRSITEVGQVNTATLWTDAGSCSAATTSIDAEMMNSNSLNLALASCDSVMPSFRIGNVGLTTLTSCTVTLQVDGVTQKVMNWTGSLATYANATITGSKVGSSVAGSHTITAICSNPNATVDPNSANNSTTSSFLVYPAVGGSMVSESFETAGIPTTFMLTPGTDGSVWQNATVGCNSNASTGVAFYSIGSGVIDLMGLPSQSFLGTNTASMTFDVAHAQYQTEADKLEVQVSTNCGTTWTSVYTKSGATLATSAATSAAYAPATAADWRHETVGLSAYAGQAAVLVRFKATSAYGNNLYVDNINFSTSSGIQEIGNNVEYVNIYPNPVSDEATVSFSLTVSNDVTISLMNALGQVVKTDNLGKLASGLANYTINTSTFNNGLYFLNINVGGTTITKKVTISK